jgi:hypothetical protein
MLRSVPPPHLEWSRPMFRPMFRPILLAALAVLLVACGTGAGSAGVDADPTAVTLEPLPDATDDSDGMPAPTIPTDPDPGPPDADTSACRLLDRSAAELAVGGALEEQVSSPGICKLILPGTPGSLVLELTLGEGANVYDRELELLGADADVAGLGDRAFRSGNIVAWQQGDTYLALTILPSPMQRVATEVFVSIGGGVAAGLEP